MTMQTVGSSKLGEMAAKWRKALSAGENGPLIIAAEVMSVVEEWGSFSEEETEGLTATAWLRRHVHPGRGVPWFSERRDAVASLGEASRRTFHHEVAVWLYRNVKDRPLIDGCVMAIVRATREQRGALLTRHQARRILRPILGSSLPSRPPASACARCARLEDRLRAAGLEVEDDE